MPKAKLMKIFPKFVAAFCLLSASGLFAQTTDKNPKDNPAFIKQAAYKIDSLVAGWYRQQNLPVPQVTDDATFLRRAFMVSIGRVPTAEEARSFLEIEDADKRSQLVDYLLHSPGYSSHMTNWVFDLVRFAEVRNFPLIYYREWIRSAMENNMPWTEFTEKILSSSGSGWDKDSAPVGYYVRDRGMPLDNLSNSMRIFLGARMECAQCHDDPFGETERHDFYQLAAFTEGTSGTGLGMFAPVYRAARALPSKGGKDSPTEYGVAELFRNGVFESRYFDGGSGSIKLPSDYQYKDAKPGEMVGAKTPFGQTVRMSEKEKGRDGRKQFADWVMNRTGEQFPSVIANRMWKRVMGRPIYDPVDQYVHTKDTNLPAMAMYLPELMKELNYDLRTFQKVLLNTKTFQFVPNPQVSKVASGDDFHGRQLARLSAEQVWDSLITLATGDPDKKPRRRADDRIYLGDRPVLVGKMDMPQLSKTLLAMKSEDELRKYFKEFVTKVEAETKGTSSSMMSMSMMDEAPAKYGPKDQVRASELPSPAPQGHLLYLFGQSDRQVVEASNSEPNVSQVLTLMNGFVQQQLANNPQAHIYKSLEGASTDEEKIRRIYIAVLSRTPSEEEMKWMLEELKASSEGGIRNIVSALVMSSEFLFLQ
jgi:hypothetical protein